MDGFGRIPLMEWEKYFSRSSEQFVFWQKSLYSRALDMVNSAGEMDGFSKYQEVYGQKRKVQI